MSIEIEEAKAELCICDTFYTDTYYCPDFGDGGELVADTYLQHGNLLID